MSKVLKKSPINLTHFKNGLQLATIEGTRYAFNFTESELFCSITANSASYDLEKRSGLDRDDYTNEEMAFIIAGNWDEADVLTMIESLPANELPDYLVPAAPAAREEHSHAA